MTAKKGNSRKGNGGKVTVEKVTAEGNGRKGDGGKVTAERVTAKR
jgi:hypothetical protein